MASTYFFIDGGYLRQIAKSSGLEPFNPRKLAIQLIGDCGFISGSKATLSRIIYFDAEPDGDDSSNELSKYWAAVESLNDTHLGFGWLRGKSNRKGPRQKAVDTLLAVDMVSGAYTRRYDAAVLVAGDADFVPIVNEVRRAGPHVIVAAGSHQQFACSDDLKKAADRFVALPSEMSHGQFKYYFEPLAVTSE